MKTMTAEMKEYIVRGMHEELEKDNKEQPNYIVRWHEGMYHETTEIVRQWMECVKLGKEEDADFHFSVLENALEWWKDYFDFSPEHARYIQDARKERLINEYKKERKQKELAALSELENMEI